MLHLIMVQPKGQFQQRTSVYRRREHVGKTSYKLALPSYPSCQHIHTQVLVKEPCFLSHVTSYTHRLLLPTDLVTKCPRKRSILQHIPGWRGHPGGTASASSRHCSAINVLQMPFNATMSKWLRQIERHELLSPLARHWHHAPWNVLAHRDVATGF